MAFRFSRKAFGQLLKTQARTLTTSSAARTLARSAAPTTVTCSRATFVRAFSTTRVALSAEASQEAQPEQKQEDQQPEEQQEQQEQTPMDGGRVVHFSNLPFFTDKEAFQKLLEEFGTIEAVRWATMAKGAPLCRVKFVDPADAAALVESSEQEPFYYGGRTLNVKIAMNRPGWEPRIPREEMAFPPSRRVYFKRFQGDLADMREWLGPHAAFVNHAFFSKDRETNQRRDMGVITFSDVDKARAAIKEKKGQPGPDGEPVYLRYAVDRTQNEDNPRRERREESTEEA